ncbi:AMP binding protein [Mycena floridula]|nr:AMP binding protein [Mycena floridula]
MTPQVYTSPWPPYQIVNRSIVTHIFSGSPQAATRIPETSAAFIDAASGTTLTRSQFKLLVLALGHGLRAHPLLGANKGDTVLIFSPNSLAWPVLLYGAMSAGLRCTLANSAYTSRELAHQYKDSGAKIIFTSEQNGPVVREMCSSLGISTEKVVVVSDCLAWAGGPSAPRRPSDFLFFEDLFQMGSLVHEVEFNGQDAHETALLCYSSGTTGNPKASNLTTHQNLTSVVDGAVMSFDPLISGQDSVLGVLPFYHIYGSVKLLLFLLYCGVPLVIQTRFEPDQFCANIERYKITSTFIVPPILVVLARHPAAAKHDMTSLRVVFSGAAPLGEGLVKQVQDRFLSFSKDNAKLAFIQCYGLTETSPTAHNLRIAHRKRKPGSIGLLVANLEARVVVDDDGKIDAAEGEPGELWLRGPTIMKGYLNNPVATKNAITEDGWFHTGDVCIRDREGFYYIVDRRKELIKYKGFQVPPAELESVLLTHEDIADAAVIGVYVEAEATEMPRAYVVHAQPEKLKNERDRLAFGKEVATWIENRVARHKFLRGGVVVVDSVPKSPAGKILRKELRERVKREKVSAKL